MIKKARVELKKDMLAVSTQALKIPHHCFPERRQQTIRIDSERKRRTIFLILSALFRLSYQRCCRRNIAVESFLLHEESQR